MSFTLVTGAAGTARLVGAPRAADLGDQRADMSGGELPQYGWRQDVLLT